VLSAFVALRARGAARVIWLAAATAVIYALVNAVTKSGVDVLMSKGAGVLTAWEPYALMVAGILGGLFGQSAFNAGPLSLSLPVIDTVEPISSVSLAAAVFHEHLARSPWLLAFQLAGGAIAAAGIALLSRSPVVLAEERRQSRSADPQADHAPQVSEAGEPQAASRPGACSALSGNCLMRCAGAGSGSGRWRRHPRR
jgi:hypothetical protein